MTVGRLTFWFIYTIVSFVKSVLDYVAFVIPFYAEAEIALVVFLAFGGGAKMAYGLLRPILKQHEAAVDAAMADAQQRAQAKVAEFKATAQELKDMADKKGE